MPREARDLKNTMAKDGWPWFGPHLYPEFKMFWEVLEKLSEFNEDDGKNCKTGCGNPGCEIRKCAKEKSVELCPMCAEFPCEHVNALAKGYGNLIPDGKRIKDIGVEKWLEEQEERRRAGFCYSDIRYPAKEEK
jgi:hypothetical protein